jgi:hypothetical protein
MAGAILAVDDTDVHEAYRQFGIDLGMAFQMADDVKGTFWSSEDSGKPEAGDIRKRKKTLPVVWALENAADDRRRPSSRSTRPRRTGRWCAGPRTSSGIRTPRWQRCSPSSTHPAPVSTTSRRRALPGHRPAAIEGFRRCRTASATHDLVACGCAPRDATPLDRLLVGRARPRDARGSDDRQRGAARPRPGSDSVRNGISAPERDPADAMTTKPPTVSYASSSGSSSSERSKRSRRSSMLTRPSRRQASSSSVTLLEHRLLGVVLVLDLAHDLLDDVLEGHEARGAAVLVTTIAMWRFWTCISWSRSSTGFDSGT